MMCNDGKVAYSTLRGAADGALEQLEKFDRVQRPYCCEHCGRYHLTTQAMNGSATLSADMVRLLAAQMKGAVA
jgi:hypothetical protein